MGSIRTAEMNGKMYSEDHDSMIKRRTKENETPSPKSTKVSQTPEYVKRTAKLFESVKESNGKETVTSYESFSISEKFNDEKDGGKTSSDSIDGEAIKKPSYLGVSCSNSGYRNVINYDSKLREGFWTANSQRESLVLCNSRVRESSPYRLDLDFKYQPGANEEPFNVVKTIKVEREQESLPVNGVSQTDKFVNISTSTKTISTFRNSRDVKVNGFDTNIINEKNNDSKSNGEQNVNLKQILNGRTDTTNRRGYSNLGFSPKILKSPEKNCNSFLKSISSFENNCKTSKPHGRSPSYSRGEQLVCDSSNSIQERIERLYGPGALAPGFYTQKSNLKTKMEDTNEQILPQKPVETHQQTNKVPISLNSLSKPMLNGNISLNAAPQPEVATTEKCLNGLTLKETQVENDECEKNGHYFLKLLKKETDRLESLASFAESELENGENLPEEINGKLRAAAGKARLLVCQKLNQFEGLCQKNLNEKPSDPFPTTSEDLAGFWDMVMLQVVQVYGVFEDLEELKKNNWKATTPKKESVLPVAANGQSSVKSTPRKSTPTPVNSEKASQKSEAAKKAREETRKKMLEDRRKKMKELKENKIVNGDKEVEIFAK